MRRCGTARDDVPDRRGGTARGISLDELRELIQLGIVAPSEDGRFTSGAIRRVGLVHSLVAVGIPLDGLGAAIRSGQVSLDFLDEAACERFSALSGVTFAELSPTTARE